MRSGPEVWGASSEALLRLTVSLGIEIVSGHGGGGRVQLPPPGSEEHREMAGLLRHLRAGPRGRGLR